MKRSFNLDDGSTSDWKRKTTKVNNSLHSDVHFAWPAALYSDHQQQQQNMPIVQQHEQAEDVSEYTCFTDDSDGFSDMSGSLTDQDCINNDLLDLLTKEDWLSEEDTLDFPGDVFKLADATTNTTMDQGSTDFFMAEYLKIIANPSCQHISFSDFVKVSTDMITSYTQVLASNKNVVVTKMPRKEETHCSAFDFSIQNWQKRTLAQQKANHHSNYPGAEQYEQPAMANQWHMSIDNYCDLNADMFI
jgi:hypothetical protein